MDVMTTVSETVSNSISFKYGLCIGVHDRLHGRVGPIRAVLGRVHGGYSAV